MRFVLSSTGLRAAAAGCVAIGAAILMSACAATQNNSPDVIAGKRLFVSKCGSCHTLARAGTKGMVGPNLDQAFEQGLKDGLGRSGIRALVRDQIKYPNLQGAMPAKLVDGQKADEVAAYVAQSVAKAGQDSGLLASAVKKAGGGKPAVAKAGTLQIDADPTGQLAFVTGQAKATPGKIAVKMQNKSGTPHDIVIDGKGKGQIVTNGGTSQFSATFAPGKYTYYCSVDAHRQAGMRGTLTVK